MGLSTYSSYQDNLNKLINGFSPKVNYEGQGVAEFSLLVGRIKGKTTAQFDEFGDQRVQMIVSTLTVEGQAIGEGPLYFKLLDFFAGKTPISGFGIHGSAINNPCTLMTVSTPQGRLITNTVGKSYTLEQLDSGDVAVTFSPLTAYFESDDISADEFFVFPLLNFVPDFHRFPVVGSIQFSFNEKLALIVPLPSYNAINDDLLVRKHPKAITAFVVGSTAGQQIDIYNWTKSRFRSLLNLLSLATGSRVGSPWLEIRNAAGDLIRRHHINMATSGYRKGVAAFTAASNRGGISEFLSQAQNSPELKRLYLRAAISQIILGGYYDVDGNIEDRMSHVFRGLDALCAGRGLKKGEEPKEYLGDELSKKVLERIETLRNEIGRLSSPDLTASVREDINALKGRIKTARLKPSGYGKSILKLLNQYELLDAHIIDTYIEANPTSFKYCKDTHKDWASVVSAYRGIVIHNAWFDWEDDPPDTSELIALTFHIRDIVLRLILKLLNYDGEYTPSTWTKHGMNESLDWVNDKTTPLDLGYGRKLN